MAAVDDALLLLLAYGETTAGACTVMLMGLLPSIMSIMRVGDSDEDEELEVEPGSRWCV